MVEAAEVEEPEELVSPTNTNVGALDYLTLQDYFVTAAERIPTHIMDTPANVTVITAEEIEANHYQDLNEALSHVNGVVVFNGGSAFKEVVMNGDIRVLLLINGRRANNIQNTIFPTEKSELTMLPSMKMIERIEIVKGGYSALYGSDAVGGVINIVTKKGNRDETTVDLNFGSWNRYNYEITNQGIVGDNLSWFLTGNIGKSKAYEPGGVTTSPSILNSDYNDDALSFRLDNTFDESNSLTLDFMHRTHHYYSKLGGTLYNNLSLSYNFKENSTVPGWFRYFNNYRKNSVIYTELNNSRMQGFEYQNGWDLGKHKLIVGAEYHKSTSSLSNPEIDGNTYNYIVDANGNYELISDYDDLKNTDKAVYLQDTISLGKKWSFIPGVRYDHNDKFGHKWLPKISTNYRADDKTKIYASWGRVLRVPTTAELYINDDGTFYYGNYVVMDAGTEEIISPTGTAIALQRLTPEVGHTEMIGLEHSFNDDTIATLNFFNSRLNNVIGWEASPAGYISRNIESQKSRGMELTFRQKINEHFGYNLGYSHTKLDYSATADHYSQPNGYRVGLHYSNKNFKANLLSIMTSGLDESVFASKNWALFDLNTSYDINESATVYFKALNFTNQNYSHVSANYPAYGRFLQAGFQYKF